MKLDFEGHTIEVPDSVRIGDVFKGPNGRELRMGFDEEVYEVLPDKPELRRAVEDYLKQLEEEDQQWQE